MYRILTDNNWSLVTGYKDGSEWIFQAEAYQGIAGSGNERLWQILPDGVLRVWDIGSRTILANLNLDLTPPLAIRSITARERLLYVLNTLEPQAADSAPGKSDKRLGEIAVVDLDDLRLVDRQSGLPIAERGPAIVMDDGSLLMPMVSFRDGQSLDELVRIDGNDYSVSRTSVQNHKVPNSYAAVHWYNRSPDGKWWLRFDPTYFPVVEHAPAPGDLPRRYFGLTLQLWSAFPLKFERRIIVSWLKAENLPDASKIFKPWEVKSPPPTPLPTPAIAPTPSPHPLRRLFGRKGTQIHQQEDPAESLDPKEAAMLASIPAREEIYLAISAALHRPDSSLTEGFPNRAAFGARAETDDAFWLAITENLQKLVRDALGHVAGWQDDCAAMWIDRVGFLICVGMDGTVSPQIWAERLGLQKGMMVPFANKPEKLVIGSKRQAIGVLMPRETIKTFPPIPAKPGGSFNIDGSPIDDPFESYMLPSVRDGWQEGAAAIPADLIDAEELRKKLAGYKLERSKVRVPIAGLDTPARESAIHQLSMMVDAQFLQRADDHEIDVGFVLGHKVIPEREFFEGISSADKAWAVPALRQLIERYVAAARNTRDTYYQPDSEAGSVFAQAVQRLGVMDEDSLPLLAAFGEQLDGGHEYFFAGETVPAVIEAHGWTDQVTGFVAWAMLYNFYNTYDRISTVWINLGLRNALEKYSPEEAARWLASEFSEFVSRGRLEWSTLVTLKSELSPNLSSWDSRFFDAMGSVVPELAPPVDDES